MTRMFRSLALPLLVLLVATGVARSQSGIEAAKRAYFEGRFEESVRMLEPLQGSAAEKEARREIAFFLGLNRYALGEQDRGRSHFESAVRHDPAFVPSDELFNPTIIGQFAAVRSSLVGRLAVESTPPGARIRVGANEVGTAPYQGAVLAGEQVVRLELDGYVSEENRVVVRAGEDSNLSVSLRPSTTAEEPSESDATQTAPSGGGGGISGTTIGIIAGAGGAAAIGLAVAGGGSSSTGTTTPPVGGGGTQPTSASFSVAIVPSVIQAQRTTQAGFDFLVQFDVVIQEGNGLGGNVDFVNVTLREAGTGNETPPVNFGSGEIIGLVGTNQVPGRGRLEIPLGVVYTFSGGGSAGVATVAVQLTDARGNRTIARADAAIR